LLLKTHADPSLLLRMTVWVIAFPHRVSAHHGQPERLSMLRMTVQRAKRRVASLNQQNNGSITNR
jgi:hypothetical protein